MDLQKIKKSFQRRINSTLGGINSGSNEVGLYPEDEPEAIESSSTTQVQLPGKAQTRSLPVNNPTHEKEILDRIEAVYYSTDDFDAGEYELKKLAEVLDSNDINTERRKLREQLSVVSKKVSTLILENHPSYAAELQKVTEVQRMLSDTFDLCKRARSNLKEAQYMTSGAGLKLLANHKKMQLLRRLMTALRTIKTLHETDYHLRDLLQEGNFPAAIQLCFEGRKATETYSHFSCIGELSCKLSDTLVRIEEQLDDALASVTLHFDPDRYAHLNTGYTLLSKVPDAALKLIAYFRATLENSARTVLVDYVSARKVDNKFESLSYEELCKEVSSEKLTDCLRELGLVLCKILSTYHAILRYHIEEDERLECGSQADEVTGQIQRSMRENLHTVCQSAVEKITVLLQRHDLTAFKFDNFLEIIGLANRFEKFGRRYFGNGCEAIASTIESQTASYFRRYHLDRLDELRMFLESEAWALCPVQSGFNVFELQEFGFLKRTNPEDDYDSPEDHEKVPDELNYELMPVDAHNPFEGVERLASELEEVDGAVESDSDDSDEELEAVKQDYVDETGVEQKYVSKLNVLKPSESMPPVLCNTALNLLRFFGRYLHMTYMLRSVANDAIVGLTELFDYYLYSVCAFFCSDATNFGVSLCGARLSAALRRIESTLIVSSRNSPSKSHGRLPACRISPVVQFNYPDRLFGLAERVVGVESLVFIGEQVHALRPVMQSLLSQAKLPFLQQFFAQTVSGVAEVRRAAYGAVATRALNYDHLLAQVTATKWDIGELRSQHSAYVDFLLHVLDLANFAQRLAAVAEATPLCREAHDILWDVVILCANKTLIQGYAEPGRKCSNEGRALMQLDLQQLVSKLEKMIDLRPIPHKALVENYVKAYYLPESALEDWIVRHEEYSPNQRITLLNVATHVSKKARNRMIEALQENEYSPT